ncbi:MAG TPA: hypothetical protein VKQ27_01065, partial [Acetobacteraceae bacterium]|nr:hypothetical protein [Acetobacteraceae bacterium]
VLGLGGACRAENAHLGGPPLLTAQTSGTTPFRLSSHVGDVGHMLIVGGAVDRARWSDPLCADRRRPTPLQRPPSKGYEEEP